MNLHSDYPFWMIKEGILSNFPTLNDNKKVEVVIIGGRITDALTTHQLSNAGMKVMVLIK